MLITDWQNTQKILVGKETFDFISSVMPEYSTKLMKTYSEKKIQFEHGSNFRDDIAISEQFTKKYQTLEFKLSNLRINRLSDVNFLQELFINQCPNLNTSLPSSMKCDMICDGVMMDGISNAINFLATRIEFIDQMVTLDETSYLGIVRELDDFSILLYHLIQPVILQIQEVQW